MLGFPLKDRKKAQARKQIVFSKSTPRNDIVNKGFKKSNVIK